MNKRHLRKRLDNLEPGATIEDYPRATLCEVLSADEARVKESLDDAVVLLVDGEEMAMPEQMFGEFWVADLEQANDQGSA